MLWIQGLLKLIGWQLVYLEVSSGRGSKEVMEVLYIVERWASLGILQSGTSAHDTDLRQDTLARRRPPHDGSCIQTHVIQVQQFLTQIWSFFSHTSLASVSMSR